MCEIFFLKATDGTLGEEIIRDMLETATMSSNQNSDGFGAFNEKREIFKSKKEFNSDFIDDLVEMYKGSEFLVFHLRMATNGGVKKKNAHPFEYRENILVHNGVVHNSVNFENQRPDSYDLLREITLWKGGEDENTTVDAIKNTLDQASGSVSVFLYDYKGDLYYFRHRSNFYFGATKDKEYILGATRKFRLKQLMKDRKKELGFFNLIQEPEAGKILQIKDVGIAEVGEFEMPSYSYGHGSSYWSSGSNSSRNSDYSDGKSKTGRHNRKYQEKQNWTKGMTYDEYKKKKEELEEKTSSHSLPEKPPKAFRSEEGNYMEVNL